MAPTGFFRHSLKTRITLATVGLFLASLWFLSYYAGRVLHQEMERLLGEQQLSTASILASQVNHELEKRLEMLKKVASLSTAAMRAGPDAVQEFIERRYDLQEMFNGDIAVHGADGRVIAGFPAVAERNGLGEVDGGVIAAALRNGRSGIGYPVGGSMRATPVFAMAVPIVDAQGKIVGALSGGVDLQKPNFLDHIAGNYYTTAGGYVVLVDSASRLIVTSSDRRRVMERLPDPGVNSLLDRFVAGEEGFGVAVNPLGVKILAAARNVPVAGWYASVVLPVDEVFSPIREMQQKMLLSTLLVTLLAGGLTWWTLRRQLSPLLETANALAVQSESKQRFSPLPVTSRDEIGQLINGFNRLIETVERREKDLLRSEAFGLSILDSVSSEIAVLDPEGIIIVVNQAWQRFAAENGIEPGKPAPRTGVGVDYLAVARAGIETSRDVLAAKACEGIQAVLDGRLPSFGMEYPCHTPTRKFWFSLVATPLGPGRSGAVVSHTDITGHKNAEEALREQKDFFHLIAENIGDFIAVLDLEGRRLYNSPSYAQFLRTNRDLQGTDSFAEIHPEDRERVKAVFRETVRSGKGRQLNYRFLMADGRVRDMESQGNVILDSEGRVARVVVVSRDITERKQMEDRILQLAFHDPLTQLPNRRLLNDRLSQTMAASTRSGLYGALMFLDLDNFKPLNDTYGHSVGDLLLLEVADRLKSCVREMDTVARFGGDEFVVMIGELERGKSESHSEAKAIADKIRIALSVPYVLEISRDGVVADIIEHRCTASIGVVLFNDHEASQDDLLKWADQAMYRAKEAGRNSIQFTDAGARPPE